MAWARAWVGMNVGLALQGHGSRLPSLHHAAPGRNRDIVVSGGSGGHALALQLAMLASLPSSSKEEDDVR